MTIVSGFLTGESAIICADSEEVISDYSKSSTQKIRIVNFHGGNWRMGIAGSGDGTYIDLFESEVMSELAPVQHYDHAKIVSTIRRVLRRIHQEYIWPRDPVDRPSIQFLIALQQIKPSSGRGLLMTQDAAVLTVMEYKSIGVGAYLADYLYKSLTPTVGITYNLSTAEACNLGILLLKEVKKSIQHCDGETNIAIFHGDGSFRWVLTSEINQVEWWLNQLQSNQMPITRSVLSPTITIGETKARLTRFADSVLRIKNSQTQPLPLIKKPTTKRSNSRKKADQQ